MQQLGMKMKPKCYYQSIINNNGFSEGCGSDLRGGVPSKRREEKRGIRGEGTQLSGIYKEEKNEDRWNCKLNGSKSGREEEEEEGGCEM